jgi:hypothetical protein
MRNNKGQFEKGNLGIWFGKKRTDEDKQKMSKPKTKKYIDLEKTGNCKHCKLDYVKVIHNQLYCKTCVPDKFAYGNMTKYGISNSQYLGLLNSNNGMCIICQNEKATDIDHCHISGMVRGMICHNCNMMLGHSKDNPETLLNAIEYLKQSTLQNYGM